MQTKKKYGFPLALCMVIGIVIGSGVFFKSEKVLTQADGNLTVGVAAWLMGGGIMLCCAYCFAIISSEKEDAGGVTDYARALISNNYAYFMGWFLATVYYPTLTAVLSYVSARYICTLFSVSISGFGCMLLSFFLLFFFFFLNLLAPIIARKIQVSTTLIKLIPLILMAFIGTSKGLSGGMLKENFLASSADGAPFALTLFNTLVATAFAYEGWIVATTINSELKEPKRTLPKALVVGSITVTAVYVLYFIGLCGTVSTGELISQGENAVIHAFTNVFGSQGGNILFIFVIISCLGTLNGLLIGGARGIYALAVRGEGPFPQIFSRVNEKTGIPTCSAIFSLAVSCLWLLYYYGASVRPMADKTSLFGVFSFDCSELPVVSLYGMYIPIFIGLMKKEKSSGIFKSKVIPSLATLGALFMIFAAFYAHGYLPFLAAKAQGKFEMPVLFFLIIWAVIMIIGVGLNKNRHISYK